MFLNIIILFHIPQGMSVYPPNTYELFLIIVTVCGFLSQRLWNVLEDQP